MDEARPDAMRFIRQYHSKIWSRSQFLTHCKVDYVTNNLVEKKKSNETRDIVVATGTTSKPTRMCFPPR
jgi:hypothetical protein